MGSEKRHAHFWHWKMKPDPRASTASHRSLISSLSVDYRKLYNNGFTSIQGTCFQWDKAGCCVSCCYKPLSSPTPSAAPRRTIQWVRILLERWVPPEHSSTPGLVRARLWGWCLETLQEPALANTYTDSNSKSKAFIFNKTENHSVTFNYLVGLCMCLCVNIHLLGFEAILAQVWEEFSQTERFRREWVY